jgi:hypothetical protein
MRIASEVLFRYDQPMLPALDEDGYLPFGIHPCTMDELVSRFGSGSSEREIEIQELVQFVQWAKRAGVRRLIVNGSFVTQKGAPNDVDIVILPGADYPRDQRAVGEEETLWPFLQIFVADDDADLEAWALGDFGTDRDYRKKGVVEVIL